MHLLAAQPGGFVDEEGIIDLDQSPADIIILSAADSTLAALAGGVQALPADSPSVRLANWMQLLKPAAYDLYEHKVLDHAQVVVVSLLGGQNYWQYGFERLQAWAAADKARRLIIVPGDDARDPELVDACTVPEPESQRVWRYLREGGLDNAQQLLQFLGAHYLQQDCRWHEPRVLPRCMMYMPDSNSDNYNDSVASRRSGQASFAEWQQRWHNQGNAGRPVCLLLFYRSHLQSANTAMFDELIAELERQRLNPLPIALASLKDAESMALVNALVEQSRATLIINTTGFASNTVASPDLSSQPSEFYSPFAKPVPVLQLVLSSSTEADWRQYAQGLRSRDIAMQVVLPEMDGRIITRAVSFKTESYFDRRCQVSVVRYALHRERAAFVAELAARYAVLSSKANADKRIALVLANYPTKDGRIGNGVGLDTPASTINILNAMAAAGYPLGELSEQPLPETGDALIQQLLGAVTNNPNTLHQLPCWQSLDVAEYLRYFQRLPQSCQDAVNQQWGPPEQDIKFRSGRLMLSGIRLGETFVGIQPARGFNIDLVANYHDPDLIPPHNYLAFYFWLRHCYQVDAILHVGKHGNLEWLPGKGSALSDQCWPDIALGPTPHFYPFIVNDPGEGAQAKRRTQAVIIDHLMPPMTRAESYGELAELEGLVDEYYQALGMDSRREQWLRDEILKQLRQSNVLDELTAGSTASGNAEDQEQDQQLLADLDAYLCDIKEAQIRHGLHILGALPDIDKLTDTLVALLRLPRGSDACSQGILHNLSDDLNLWVEGTVENKAERFDPLDASTNPWTGPRPPLLASVSDDAWRTEADTRERLELLAHAWIKDYVLEGGDIDAIAALDAGSIEESAEESVAVVDGQPCGFPNTRTQLLYARERIYQALQQSAELEIGSLLGGLSGRFVPPGPSGAPTRGRLDTLPTGRNFFSVDNRSIPSPAAWAIGERSAQALLERHLQEHGDYPRQLGLSVWGTATMRTGGDDIAQAFALMGVRPLWAPGSHRVVDFEVLSSLQLGRPRVDVTLRVSGFFRDAFANVMKLYDAAVQAIAALDEPGNGNTIQANIRARQQQLVDEGMSEQEAARQASYRVFGSKPGAYGAGLQGLIDERCWENRGDLAEAYLNWGGYAYGNQPDDGVAAPGAFKHQLSQLEAVVQNQDNREHDILDSDDYYQFQGGMTNAVTVYSGQAPEVYHNDHSNPSAPKVRTLKEELNRVIRSRVLNPKWINAMREHGYKGAFEMAASVDYLFAYDATTNLIADYQYQKVADALVFDQQNRDFLQQHNPNALEEMAERLLEATQRGLWQEPGEYAEALQSMLLDMDEQQESL